MKDYFTGQNLDTQDSELTDKLMFGLNQLTYFGGLAVGIGGIRKLYASANFKTQEYVKSTVKNNLEKINIDEDYFFNKMPLANQESDLNKQLNSNIKDTLTSSGIEKELNQIHKQIKNEVSKNANLSDIEKEALIQDIYERESRQYLALKELSTNTAKQYLESTGLKYVDINDVDRYAMEIIQEGQYGNKNNLTRYQRNIFRKIKNSGLFENIELFKKADNSIDIVFRKEGNTHTLNLPKGFYSQDLLGSISGITESGNPIIKIENKKVINPFFNASSQTKALGMDVLNVGGMAMSIDSATTIELEVENLLKKLAKNDGRINAQDFVDRINTIQRNLVVTASPEANQRPVLNFGIKSGREYSEQFKSFTGLTEEFNLQTDPFNVEKSKLVADVIDKQDPYTAKMTFDEFSKNPRQQIIDIGLFKRFKTVLERISKNEKSPLYNAARKFLLENRNSNDMISVDSLSNNLKKLYTKAEKGDTDYRQLVEKYEHWQKRTVQRAGTGGYYSINPELPFATIEETILNKSSSSAIAVSNFTHKYQIEERKKQNMFEPLNNPTSSAITAQTIDSSGKKKDLAPRINTILMSSKVANSYGVGLSGGVIILGQSGESFTKQIGQRFLEKYNSKIELGLDPVKKGHLFITIHNANTSGPIILTGDDAKSFYKDFIYQNRAIKRNKELKRKLKVGNQEALIVKNYGKHRVEKNRKIFSDGILAFKSEIKTITAAKEETAGAKGNYSPLNYEDTTKIGLDSYLVPNSKLPTIIRNMSDDFKSKTLTSVEFNMYENIVNKTYDKLVEHTKKIQNKETLTSKELQRIRRKVLIRTTSAFYGNKENLNFGLINEVLKGNKVLKREYRGVLKPLITGLKEAREYIKQTQVKLVEKKDNVNKSYLEVIPGKISRAEYGRFNPVYDGDLSLYNTPSSFYDQDKLFETTPDGTDLQLKRIDNRDPMILRDTHLSAMFKIKNGSDIQQLSMFSAEALEAIQDNRKSNEIVSLEMIKTTGFKNKKPTLNANFFISIEQTLPLSDFTVGDQFKKVKMNTREMAFLKLSNPYMYDLISHQIENRNTWLVNHFKYLKTSMEIFDQTRNIANREIVRINKKPLNDYKKSKRKNLFLYNDKLQAENIVKEGHVGTGKEYINLKQIIKETIESASKLKGIDPINQKTDYDKAEKIHKTILHKLGSKSSYGINEIFEVQAREIVDILNKTTNLKPGEVGVLDLEEFFGYKKDALGPNARIVIQGIDPKEISDSIAGTVKIDGQDVNVVRFDPQSPTSLITKLFSAREAIDEIKNLQKKDRNRKNPIYEKLIKSVENVIFGGTGVIARHKVQIERKSITDGSLLQRFGHQMQLEGMSTTIKSSPFSITEPNRMLMNEETFIRKSLGDKVYKEARDVLSYGRYKKYKTRVDRILNSDKYNYLKDAVNIEKNTDGNIERLQKKNKRLNRVLENIKENNKGISNYVRVIENINKTKKELRILKNIKKNKDLVKYFNNELWETIKVKNEESLLAYEQAKVLAEQIKKGKKYSLTSLRHPTMSELNMTDLFVKIDERIATGDIHNHMIDIEQRLQGDTDKDRQTIIARGIKNLISEKLGVSKLSSAIAEISADIYGLRSSLFEIKNTSNNPQDFNVKALNYTADNQMSNILELNNNSKALAFDQLDKIVERQIKFAKDRFNLSYSETTELRKYIEKSKSNLLFNGENIDSKNVFFLEKSLLNQEHVNEYFKSSIKEGFLILKTQGAAGLELPIKDTRSMKYESQFGLDSITIRKRRNAKIAKDNYYKNWSGLIENLNSTNIDTISDYVNKHSTGVKLQKQDAATLYKENTMNSFALSVLKKGLNFADHHAGVLENINVFLKDFTTTIGEVPLQSKHGTPSIVSGMKDLLTTIRTGGNASGEAAQKLFNFDFNVDLSPEERIFFNKTNTGKLSYKNYKAGLQKETQMYADLFNFISGEKEGIAIKEGKIIVNGNLEEIIKKVNTNVASASSGKSYHSYLQEVAEKVQLEKSELNLVGHLKNYAGGTQSTNTLGQYLLSGMIKSQKKLEGMSKLEGSMSMSFELADSFSGSVSALYKNNRTKAFMHGIEQGYDLFKGQNLKGEKVSKFKIREVLKNLKTKEYREGFSMVTSLDLKRIEKFVELRGQGKSISSSLNYTEPSSVNFEQSANISKNLSSFKGIGKSALVGTLIGMGINQIISGFSIPDLKESRGLGGEYWENKATKSSEKMLKPRPPRVEVVNPSTIDNRMQLLQKRQKVASKNPFMRDGSRISKNDRQQETLGIRIR